MGKRVQELDTLRRQQRLASYLLRVLHPLLRPLSIIVHGCCHPLPPAGQEGKAKHAKAKHDTSYKEMAIYALQQVGSLTQHCLV